MEEERFWGQVLVVFVTILFWAVVGFIHFLLIAALILFLKELATGGNFLTEVTLYIFGVMLADSMLIALHQNDAIRDRIAELNDRIICGKVK